MGYYYFLVDLFFVTKKTCHFQYYPDDSATWKKNWNKYGLHVYSFILVVAPTFNTFVILFSTSSKGIFFMFTGDIKMAITLNVIIFTATFFYFINKHALRGYGLILNKKHRPEKPISQERSQELYNYCQ